ncbi:MAG: hypothetical protein F6J96_19890 [Symploca sp. SIO1C2]|nr:hypothetical protein [Symploca sp. SIO1C2]
MSNVETFTCQFLTFCLAFGNGFAELPSALCLLLYKGQMTNDQQQTTNNKQCYEVSP